MWKKVHDLVDLISFAKTDENEHKLKEKGTIKFILFSGAFIPSFLGILLSHSTVLLSDLPVLVLIVMPSCLQRTGKQETFQNEHSELQLTYRISYLAVKATVLRVSSTFGESEVLPFSFHHERRWLMLLGFTKISRIS